MNLAAGGPKADLIHLDQGIALAEKKKKEDEADARWLNSISTEIPQAVDRYFDHLEIQAKQKSASSIIQAKQKSASSIIDTSLSLEELPAAQNSVSEFVPRFEADSSPIS